MKDSFCQPCLFFFIESATNLETIKESYTNTVNELNQELLAMKEAYDQLDAEKQILMDELEKRPINSEFSPINLSDEVCDVIYLSFSIMFEFFRFLYKPVVQMWSQKTKNCNNYVKISLFLLHNMLN